jgi:integrase
LAGIDLVEEQGELLVDATGDVVFDEANIPPLWAIVADAIQMKRVDEHYFRDERYVFALSSLVEKRKLVATYRRRAGISKLVGPHALRRTFATAKAQQGVDVYQLKEWMGHTDVNTTMGYVHRAKSPTAQKVMEDTSL